MVTGKASGVVLVSECWPQRAFLYATLRESGLDVHGVDDPSGAEAALWAWPNRFGLVVVDAAGVEAEPVYRLIRAAGRHGVPVIVLAGPFEKARMPELKELGARVITKPVSVSAVVDVARRLLGLSGG